MTPCAFVECDRSTLASAAGVLLNPPDLTRTLIVLQKDQLERQCWDLVCNSMMELHGHNGNSNQLYSMIDSTRGNSNTASCAILNHQPEGMELEPHLERHHGHQWGGKGPSSLCLVALKTANFRTMVLTIKMFWWSPILPQLLAAITYCHLQITVFFSNWRYLEPYIGSWPNCHFSSSSLIHWVLVVCSRPVRLIDILSTHDWRSPFLDGNSLPKPPSLHATTWQHIVAKHCHHYWH
jgi:hypothetical protein